MAAPATAAVCASVAAVGECAPWRSCTPRFQLTWRPWPAIVPRARLRPCSRFLRHGGRGLPLRRAHAYARTRDPMTGSRPTITPRMRLSLRSLWYGGHSLSSRRVRAYACIYDSVTWWPWPPIFPHARLHPHPANPVAWQPQPAIMPRARLRRAHEPCGMAAAAHRKRHLRTMLAPRIPVVWRPSSCARAHVSAHNPRGLVARIHNRDPCSLVAHRQVCNLAVD